MCVALLTAGATAHPRVASDPLALLSTLGTVSADERSKLDSGHAVVAVVPARGRDIAVFGITRTQATGARLVAWTREIEQLYKGRYMPAIGRFSDPPRLEDLAALTLDDEDVNDLRGCRPGDCALKLTAAEIEQIRAAAAAGPAWKEAVQLAFRQVVLARAQGYLETGLSAAPPYHDRKKPISPAAEFAEVAARIGFEPLYAGRVVPYLERFPDGERAGIESFLYWSKETLGGGKPIVSVTHVAIFRSMVGLPHTTVAARQVYATHYVTGSLSVTAITGGANGAPQYLVYLRRSRTDAFEGMFGKLVRRVVEGRIRSDAPAVLDGLRRKLEGGDPPGREFSE